MPTMQSPPGPVAVVDGREVLYFAGTGYLGLQGRPEVAEAMIAAVRQGGIGTATSRSPVGYGDSPALLRLERTVADLFGCEDALCYPSGYLGPQLLLGALEGSFDAVLIDSAAHSSLAAAAKQSDRPLIAFRHADPDDLQQKLNSTRPRIARPIVLTDGVFAATGRLAPLNAYSRVLSEYPGASLLVDDAHGVGVLGEHGRGTLEHLGLYGAAVNAVVPDPHPRPLPQAGKSPRVRLGTPSIHRYQATHGASRRSLPPLPQAGASRRVRLDAPSVHRYQANHGASRRTLPPHGASRRTLPPSPLPAGKGTLEKRGANPATKRGDTDAPTRWLCAGLSKALGGYGGVIPGSAAFIAWLKGRTPIYRGTTPLPVPVAAASTRAIELYRTEPWLRAQLTENTARLKAGLRELGLTLPDSPMPIAAFAPGTPEQMQAIQRELLRRDIAIGYSSGYAGIGERGTLRVAVFATHTAAMVNRLLAELGAVAHKTP